MSTPQHPPTTGQLAEALDDVAVLVRGIREDQWTAPTPCADWDVRAVLSHVVGMNLVFAAMLTGSKPPGRDVDPLGEDPVAAYADSAAALVAAFEQPGTLERVFTSRFGDATGADRLQIRLYDLLAHGWDLAQATGQSLGVSEELAADSLLFARAQLDQRARDGRFGPPQPVPDDAPALIRLVAFLGRPVGSDDDRPGSPARKYPTSARVGHLPMHDDELHLDADTVRHLVDDQFPRWRQQRIRRITTDGTDNAIFRIGREWAARFPLRPADPGDVRAVLARQAAAMDELAAASPVATPTPVVVGEPGHGYPLPWSVQTWLPGAIATPRGLEWSATFVRDLAALIAALRAAETQGRRFAGGGRGGDLRDSDEWMETCLRESTGLLPVEHLRRVWTGFRRLPPGGLEAMTHGDLIPANLLVGDGRLVGVLDGGGFAPADPSLDLVAGWHLLDGRRRDLLRRLPGCSDLEWARGAAWAFQQAMGLVWYYRDTNPGMAELGRTTLARILDDPVSSPAPVAGPRSP